MSNIALNCAGSEDNAHAQFRRKLPCNFRGLSEHERCPLGLQELAQLVLDSESFNDACASINFVSKDEIHKMNKQYRGIDKPTDILSFPADDLDDDMGDIFICFDIAKDNAKKFNTSIENELKLLVVHGMLHLCGYNHEDEDEAIAMEAREEELLDA